MAERYNLVTRTERCGDRSACWYGACTCGNWEHGPHFMRETVQAYWADHVHLQHEHQCALHGRPA